METVGLGRVAVLDSGEGARRVLRAIHELARMGQAGVAVAVHAPRERLTRFVRDADEAVELDRSREDALLAARADSAWLGPAPLAERAAFAEACARAGVAHIGPSAKALGALCALGGVSRLASELGVPFAETSADSPLAHLVEVVVARDRTGAVRVIGIGEASLRRSEQAVIAESPSPVVGREAEDRVRSLAARACAAADWVGVCAVRLLADPAGRKLSLLGLDAFAQSAPAIEALAGVDLALLAFRVASGAPLGDEVKNHGHAFAARIQAKDPEAEPLPNLGTVALLRLPSGLGVRADAAVAEEDEAPAGDGTLATLVARGETRAEALARLEQALADAEVLVLRSGSSKAWLLALCARSEVRSGEAGVGFLDRLAASREPLVEPKREPALLAAAIQSYHGQLDLERARFLAEARRGRPRVGPSSGRLVELRYRGRRYRLEVRQKGPQSYEVASAGGPAVELRLERVGRFERRLLWQGRHYRILSVMDGLAMLVLVDGVAHPIVRDSSDVVASPMPAVVVALPVEPGQKVAAGEQVARVESMKVEIEVKAPSASVVREVLAVVNGQVDAGAPLLRLEPLEEGSQAAPAAAVEPLDLGPAKPASGAPRDRYLAALSEMEELVLGFDVAVASAKRLGAAWRELAKAVPAVDESVLCAEEAALGAFADLQAVFTRTRPAGSLERRPPLEEFWRYLHEPEAHGAGLSAGFVELLRSALGHYGVSMDAPGRALQLALLRIQKAHERVEEQLPIIAAVLERRLAVEGPPPGFSGPRSRQMLDRLADLGRERFAALADLAREIRYRRFDQPALEQGRAEAYAQAEQDLARLPTAAGAEREAIVDRLVESAPPLAAHLVAQMAGAEPGLRARLVETLLRRYYRFRPLGPARSGEVEDLPYAESDYEHLGRRYRVFACGAPAEEAEGSLRRLARAAAATPIDREVILELYGWSSGAFGPPDAVAQGLLLALAKARFARPPRRISVVIAPAARGAATAAQQHFHFRSEPSGYSEDKRIRGIHFMLAERMQFGRLAKFDLNRLPSLADVYLFHAVAQGNPKDERLIATAEVRDLAPVRDSAGRVVQVPGLERMFHEALAGMRLFQARRAPHQRLEWNRVLLTISPPLLLSREEVHLLAERLTPAMEGVGLEMLLMTARVPDPEHGGLRETLIRVIISGQAISLRWDEPTDRPLEPMAEYQQKVVQLRRRGLTHPFEIVRMLAPPRGVQSALPPGEFEEYDLDVAGRALTKVERPPGMNTANVVVGVVRNFTAQHPEGMERVIVLGDPGREMGSVAEDECRRIVAALELAQQKGVPLEWFEVCAGAKISMKSGTENMDWVSRVLRKLIEFTQAGGEVNVVVLGITVGAQPYWNAEATMLMHTRGILVMTPGSSMVLTGKQALEYSGSVSAEDNEGIGGYDRIMGVNGQAQYHAGSVAEACQILLSHYDHCYFVKGEAFPRRAPTSDPHDRDVRGHPHGPEGGAGFSTVGEIFSAEKNPDRKKPFEIRRVMAACIDQDHPPLERWRDMRGGDTGVVWDAHLGGLPVCLIGIQSRPLPRLEFVPADGPEYWSAGTLFPQSSKKIARAINAASGNRPVVVLANLSGFDGSPESMRRLQLEYGAEIGRAVVNFRGPVIFCVVSRYHGGAFVVFAKTLRDNIEIAAVEGARASVIGGAPAAAVVFAREVEARTRKDPRVVEAEKAATSAAGRLRLNEVVALVRSEKLGEVGDEFDKIHSVDRARKVGSLDRIIAARDLRPYLIDAVERGMARVTKG